jgi:outer membrane protein OmpA-like peptidoglycan-associated protein
MQTITKLFFFLLLFFYSNTWAQYDKLQVPKKAMEAYKDAQSKLGINHKDEAIMQLRKAILLYPDFCDAHILLGDIYKDLGRNEIALEQYSSALAIDSNYSFRKFKSKAEIFVSMANTSEAIINYERFIRFDKLSPIEKNQVKSILSNLTYAETAMQNPMPFEPISMGNAINSKYDDYYPYLSVDGEILLFTRQVNGNEDFYESRKIDDVWQPAMAMSAPINTQFNEGSICFSPDKTQLFFARCGDKINGDGSCDIFGCYKIGDGFSKPINMGFNTADWESQPSFGSDGRTLIVSAHRKDGLGGTDLYSIQKTSQGWGELKSLGDHINSINNDGFPFLHPDNQTLYFVSSGRGGMGKGDIYYSKKLSDGTWGEAINLGYPINTVNDERGIFVTSDGKKAIISSKREGQSSFDLYEFDLYSAAQPTPVTYMKGIITDKKTGKPLFADFQLIDLSTGKIITQSNSDEITGQFLVCIPNGRNYALNVSNTNYLFYSENFTMQQTNLNQPYEKNVQLSAIEVGNSVILQNVFFETDKFDLKPASKVELNKLANFMRNNQTVKIEIGGHTDNTGLKERNISLSEKRAKAVFDFLINSNIDATRISYKGFADSKPIASNSTEEGKQQNRRTEFTITGK